MQLAGHRDTAVNQVWLCPEDPAGWLAPISLPGFSITTEVQT